MKSSGNIKILLVEDNPADVELTLEAFKESRLLFDMDVAEDGEQALDYIYKKNEYKDKKTPDLILLDLNLPKVDGFEVLEKIKNDENTRTIPVIVMTTSDSAEDIDKAYNSYANCFIHKPVDFEKFNRAVKLLEDFWFNLVKKPERK